MNRSATEYDVLIIGGGPAGIAAGIWCSELGMSSALIERGGELGGQLLNVFNPIENYPGVIAKNGTELRDLFVKNLQGRNCDVLLNCEVVSFDLENLLVSVAGDITYSGKAIILATGVRRRRLGVPGEIEFSGMGILHSGAKAPKAVSGKIVAVIGGGDAALENALILSEHAERVLLIHRRGEFSARKQFLSKVLEDRKIEVFLDSEVTRFTGAKFLESIDIKNKTTGSEENLTVDHALIRIGFQPNSELFRDQVDCDISGFVSVDEFCLTSIPGCYAVGDLRRGMGQTISRSVGDGSAVAYSLLKSSS